MHRMIPISLRPISWFGWTFSFGIFPGEQELQFQYLPCFLQTDIHFLMPYVVQIPHVPWYEVICWTCSTFQPGGNGLGKIPSPCWGSVIWYSSGGMHSCLPPSWPASLQASIRAYYGFWGDPILRFLFCMGLSLKNHTKPKESGMNFMGDTSNHPIVHNNHVSAGNPWLAAEWDGQGCVTSCQDDCGRWLSEFGELQRS